MKIALDYDAERNLFDKCRKVYDSKGMSGFEKLVDGSKDFKWAEDEKFYLFQLRELLRIANGSGYSRITSLADYFSLNEIIGHLTDCRDDKFIGAETQNYFRLKLEEFFFKNHHKEFF